MTMVEKAKAYFGKDFNDRVAWYLEHGAVYSDERLFVLACIHSKDGLMSGKENKKLDKRDCWYIQYASGDIKRLFEIMPEEKQWAVFDRRGKLRCYNLDKIRKKLGDSHG